ncbi:MAG: hypothetical protein AAB400_00750 [Patescibacteria group bacterium]
MDPENYNRSQRRKFEKMQKELTRQQREKEKKNGKPPKEQHLPAPYLKPALAEAPRMSYIIKKEDEAKVREMIARGERPPVTYLSSEMFEMIRNPDKTREAARRGLEKLSEHDRELHAPTFEDREAEFTEMMARLPFYPMIEHIVINGSTIEDVRKTAYTIYHDYIEGKKVFDQCGIVILIQRYLSCMMNIAAERSGEQRYIDHIAEVSQAIGSLTLRGLSHDFSALGSVEAALQLFTTGIDFSPEKNTQQSGTKALCEVMVANTQEMIAALTYASAFKNYCTRELSIDIDGLASEYRGMADELFSNMKQLRRYAIRESYYRDDVFGDLDYAWVVMDPQHFSSTKGFERLNAHSLAHCILSDRDSIRSISSAVEHKEFVGVAFNRQTFPFKRELLLEIGDDGELYMPLSLEREPLRNIFERVGALAAYEFLRFLFLAHFYDLVVPKEISDRTPSLQNFRQNLFRSRAQGEDDLVIFKKLMVPRTFSISNPDDVDRADEREEGDDTENDGLSDSHEHQTRRFLGRAGHTRFIREGYEPPAFLVQEAAKAKVPLKPGQTYVRTKNPGEELPPIVYEQKVSKLL